MSSDMINSNDAPCAAGARWKVPALLAAVLLSGAALADSRADAKRHVREGMSLSAAGQTDDVQRLLAQLQALINQQQAQAAAPIPAPAPAKKPDAKPVPAAAKPAHPEDEMFAEETISAKSRATAREISQQLSGTHTPSD